MKNRGHMYTRWALVGCAIFAITPLASCSVWKDLIRRKPTEKKEITLPQDREQIHTQTTQKRYSESDLAKGILSGDWSIESVVGKPAVGETSPFLRFEPSEHRVYGNNGCNVYNAQYRINPADSTISFSNPITTMMMCNKQGITDYEVNAALDAARFYDLSKGTTEYDYMLHLYDEHHVEVMSLMHQNFDFLNGTWRVAAIGPNMVNDPEMKLVIDIDEKKVHGNTGCNILNGTLDTDMETPNSISFQEIMLTRMACPDPELQTQLIVALEDASHAKPISQSRVLLIDDDGNTVLTLVRE